MMTAITIQKETIKTKLRIGYSPKQKSKTQNEGKNQAKISSFLNTRKVNFLETAMSKV